MTARIIDGRAVAAELRSRLVEDIEILRERGITCGIATVQVGDDFGASMYRDAVARMCSGLNLAFRDESLAATSTTSEVLDVVMSLNEDPAVSGILVLRPLAPGVDEAQIVDRIAPLKDIDCLSPGNLGRLMLGRRAWPPATPAACLELMERRLAEQGVPAAEGFAGAHVVIVGRSPSVGRPAQHRFPSAGEPVLRHDSDPVLRSGRPIAAVQSIQTRLTLCSGLLPQQLSHSPTASIMRAWLRGSW